MCKGREREDEAEAGTDALGAVVADAAFSVELVTSHVVDLKVQR